MRDFGAEGELVCFEVAFFGAYDNLEGGQHSITINEPGSRILTMEIRKSLSRYAPEAKKGLFEVPAEW